MAVRVCLSVSVSTHRTSVAVHQYTYQHAGPWTQHSGPSRGLFGCFWPTWAVCSVHTGRTWVSASTHRMSVAVCQHTHDVRAVRVCPCVSLCVRQHTQNVRGCPLVHISARWSFPWLILDNHRLSVGVRVCPSAHAGRPWLSVCVRGPSAHTRRPWLSISKHISTLVPGLSMLALPVDCSDDFGPHWLSV